MKNMKVRKGARLAFIVSQGDETSISATFVFGNEDTPNQSVTEPFVDGVANFEIGSPYTDIVAKYSYQINENYPTGSPDIYPDADGCEGDCSLPTFEVCEALEV